MPPLIAVQNIVKNYRRMRALNDVSFEIQPGITGLLGPNGAGKSTLIKVLMGLVRVSSGSGTVLGNRLGKQGRLIRSKIGYMPEDDCYIPGLKGVEAVQFSACLAGIPATEALRRSHEILDFCGMKQERYREIETYSTGMRQKIKFAAAIVHDPELLIFDEPTAALDPEERDNLLNRIQILCRDAGKSVLISTHILPDVQTICDHALILASGQVRLNESLEVLNRPTAPTITVKLARQETAFTEDLQRLGLQVQQDHDFRHLKVSGDRENLSQLVWKTAQQNGVSIHALSPAKNSLEEIFMSAVEEANVADS
ncbi:MAG: ABC transporter ATP-binding protein [Mariniblastus sp.]|nr:ABC transporter ATP-binding protein [Mariniblastus sp.]